MERETILQQASELIQAYLESYKLLPEGSQKDTLYKSNFLEGLICRCISDICNDHGIKANSRLSQSDYITDAAKKQLEQNNKKGLVKEHIVPKNVYFNDIVDESKKGTLTKEQIFNILNKYYWICLVTDAENSLLGKRYKSRMPGDWDNENIFARYEKVFISNVIKNNDRALK